MPRLRTLCSKLHLYVGLALSVVLIALSLTGSALVLRDELEGLLRPDLTRVQPEGARLSPGEAMGKVRTALPGERLDLVELPPSPEEPYVVWLEGERLAYVDPYRGEVLGVCGRHEGFVGTLFALHTELLAGPTGAWVVGLSGLFLVLLCATGLVLWWPSWRRLWISLTVAWRRGWHRVNYDLHRTGGFYTLAFLLLTATTGSALVFYQPASALLNELTDSEAWPPAPPSSHAAAGSSSLSTDAALEVATEALPEASATFLYLPAGPEDAFTVRLCAPGEWHPNGRSFVYVDRYRGTVLRVDDARQAPVGARLLHALYPLHIGSVGGLFVRVAYALLGLAPTVLSITGAYIWLARWRKKHRALKKQTAAPSPRPVPAKLPTSAEQP